MREIVFRGKDLKGNWYEGDFVRIENVPLIATATSLRKVQLHTVGQYTGLKDKNGVRIFEGDILRYIDDDEYAHYSSVVFFNGSFCSSVDETYTLNDLDTGNYEVVGNVHDILRGEKNAES